MKHIIFVDDEPRILHGLQRMLRGQRHEWEMTFVESGADAMDHLRSHQVDVIVSDMRMPVMDGAALLSLVQEQFPDVVRIVLSGHADMEAAMRALPVTHQFLSKPCDSDKMVAVISRACELMTQLNNDKLKSTIGKIDTLPAVPRVYQELSRSLADPEVAIEDIAAIVSKDVSISAKILQLVNSSFFGLASEITSMEQATSYLGLNMLRSLVLATEVFTGFASNRSLDVAWLEAEQQHVTLTARIARELVDDVSEKADAYMAAMLHDIGKLILATSIPASFEQALISSEQNGVALYQAEEEVNGVSHAEVGAYLLGLWGMPYPIVEAVANHHHPRRVPHDELGILGAVHIADTLAHDQLGQHQRAHLDEIYIESIGCADQIDAWHELAASLVAG